MALSSATSSTQPMILSQLPPALRVLRGNHRVVRLQAECFSIRLRGHPVSVLKVAPECLLLPSALQAHQVIGFDRGPYRNSGTFCFFSDLLWSLPQRCKRLVNLLDQPRQISDSYRVLSDVRRHDVGSQFNEIEAFVSHMSAPNRFHSQSGFVEPQGQVVRRFNRERQHEHDLGLAVEGTNFGKGGRTFLLKFFFIRPPRVRPTGLPAYASKASIANVASQCSPI